MHTGEYRYSLKRQNINVQVISDRLSSVTRIRRAFFHVKISLDAECK